MSAKDERGDERIFPDTELCRICIVGLGYVGLPLAVEFAKKRRKANNPDAEHIVGFDVSQRRIKELKAGIDNTGEVNRSCIEEVSNWLYLTNDIEDIEGSDVYIVCVPTPVREDKTPDLYPITSACETIGSAIKKGLDSRKASQNLVVVFESTVYPGLTEDYCADILEKVTGLTFNQDFFCGYSPERINPGDKKRGITETIKLTSGSTIEASRWVDALYKQIITAGTFMTESIRIAEAAKVIENTQRDLNIALANELAIIFERMNIDTHKVLEAARTKWNFLDFRPGLVGGHCIGVDPYYLTYKSAQLGYFPEVVLAGRKINDNFAEWIMQKTIREMIRQSKKINGSRVLVLGLTFKQDCPDIRNTKIIELIRCAEAYCMKVDIYDPIANADLAKQIYGVELLKRLPQNAEYDCVIAAVSHMMFGELSIEEWLAMGVRGCTFVDVKEIIPRQLESIRL